MIVSLHLLVPENQHLFLRACAGFLFAVWLSCKVSEDDYGRAYAMATSMKTNRKAIMLPDTHPCRIERLLTFSATFSRLIEPSDKSTAGDYWYITRHHNNNNNNNSDEFVESKKIINCKSLHFFLLQFWSLHNRFAMQTARNFLPLLFHLACKNEWVDNRNYAYRRCCNKQRATLRIKYMICKTRARKMRALREEAEEAAKEEEIKWSIHRSAQTVSVDES